MNGLNDATELNLWLNEHEIDTSFWGVGVAKSVEDLWAEITSGESVLLAAPPLRVVQVVNVIIRNGNKMLIEGEQQFRGNQNRYRGIPLSEKMKPGETPVGAALRGIEEELRVKRERVTIFDSSSEPQTTLRESPSFPGLRSQYNVHTVEVQIENLPDQTFWTDELPENSSDPVKRHQWQWKVVAP